MPKNALIVFAVFCPIPPLDHSYKSESSIRRQFLEFATPIDKALVSEPLFAQLVLFGRTFVDCLFLH